MTKLLIAFFSLPLLFMSAPVHAEGISISQSLSSSEIPFEDSVLFEIVLSWDGSQAAYLFPHPLNPVIDRMTIRGFSSSVSSTGQGDSEKTTKTYRYTLVPKSSGIGQIAPVTVSYISWPDSLPGEMVTEAMTVRIAEPLPPEEPPDLSVIWWVAGILIVIGAALALLMIRRSGKRKAAEPVRTLVEQFLDDLSQLKKEAGTDHKRFQTGLHRILADFLSRKYGLNPDNKSKEELKEELATAGLSELAAFSIAGWYTQAARDKFSPVTAGPGETIRLEAEIRQLFEKL